jgi:RNA polymerase sigma factor (sigma-70 family)
MATVPRTPDAALLVRLRERDQAAWEELYVEYQPRLRAFAYRLTGNAHDADDLVQETFVRAVPKLDDLDPETAEIGAYLFATTKNLFLKQVERGKRQEPVAEVPEPVAPQPIDLDPERSALLQRQQEEVRVANGRLQPRQRLVLALRELEDRSYAEIGELVGMKENAVAQLIFRARESLRSELRLAQVDPAQLPEDCRRFLPLLAAHLDGQLKGAKRDETLAHLEGCDRCQAALADMHEASRRYRTIIFLPLEGDEAKAAVDERLEQVGYWSAPPRRSRRRAAKIGGIVAAALVVGVSGTALGIAAARNGEPAAVSTTQPAAGRLVEVTTTASETAPEPSETKPVPTQPAPVKPAPTKPEPKPAAKPKPAPPPPTSPVAPPKPAPAVTAPSPPPPTPKPQPTPPPSVPPKPQPPADTRAPVVTITNGPAAATSSSGASISFTANEQGVTFACSLDGGAYQACTSPHALNGLAPGQHSFSVRGTDRAGNVGPPATVTWTYTPPDTRPPITTITSAPPATTTATSASFSFSADEAGSTFACSLDGAAFTACTSPLSYQSLAFGSHTFAVRATDQAGNVGQAQTRAWTILAPLPDLVITAFGRNSITVTNRGTATAGSSVLTITLVGTFTVPSLRPGASVTLSWSTCRVGAYTAIVDRTNVVAESNESNNTATRSNTC